MNCMNLILSMNEKQKEAEKTWDFASSDDYSS